MKKRETVVLVGYPGEPEGEASRRELITREILRDSGYNPDCGLVPIYITLTVYRRVTDQMIAAGQITLPLPRVYIQ